MKHSILEIKSVIRYYLNELKRKTLFISLRDSCRAEMMALSINKKLEIFKDASVGKSIYIVGGGPSVKYFMPEAQNAVFIGVNRAYKNDRYKFDFLFAQDHFPEGMKDFLSYNGNNCKKMLGITGYDYDIEIHESEIHGENIFRYVLESKQMQRIPQNITIKPFADMRGTVFSAIQFALYMNPKQIFLVGFDCSAGGDIFTEKNENYGYQFISWKKISKFIKENWPEIEIVSINPVGLKGMFVDQYTEDFLQEKNKARGTRYE